MNLSYIQSDGGKNLGFSDKQYDLTDRFELQLVTNMNATYRAFWLGYEQIKTKYQLYKNSSNNIFLTGTFSLKSPMVKRYKQIGTFGIWKKMEACYALNF